MEEAGCSRFLGGMFDARGSLKRLVLGGSHETSRSLPLPAGVLEVYIGALTRFAGFFLRISISQVSHPDALNNTLSRQLKPWLCSFLPPLGEVGSRKTAGVGEMPFSQLMQGSVQAVSPRD